MTSRRQRYFRARSPHSEATSSHNGEMVGLETIDHEELGVIDAETVSGNGQRLRQGGQVVVEEVTNEEVLEQEDMTLDHNDAQMAHQHYATSRQARFAVPGNGPRRPGRPPKFGASQPMALDMVAKLQNKATYAAARLPPSNPILHNHVPPPNPRVSPGGARLVSVPRKRELSASGVGPMSKRIGIPNSYQGIRATSSRAPSSYVDTSKENRPVKVVRILPNSLRQNAQLLEQSIVDLDERIKDVLEETKVDFDKWKAIAAQQPQMSPEEYHNMLGMLLNELERTTAANNALTDYHRQRQRQERNLYESREDNFNARIRQLETENRKLRENMLASLQNRFEQYGATMMDEAEQMQDGTHMIDEGHDQQQQQDNQLQLDEDVPTEWIVEQTVGDDPNDEEDVKMQVVIGDDGNQEQQYLE
ncbi:unnamed protein product [Caenorhabditis auriculariae]|uniref:Uncharacterized protein n=1 Tax=Caenorhabditis auriculariae TaxID=2777116 RepID=A0A8S1HLH9_9PELO|nr:unnamed protein product [Caenorhabditis auriculariae]